MKGSFRFFALLLMVAFAVSAEAGFVYELRYDSLGYSGSVGDTVFANLFLTETVSGTSSSEFAGRTLNGAKFRLDVTDTAVAQITGFTPTDSLANSGFVDIGAGGGFVEFNAASFPSNGPSSTVLNASTRQYSIGQVNLSLVGLGSTGFNISTFNTRTSTNVSTSPTDFLLAGSPNISIDLDNLDADRTAIFTSSTITAVPEPSSLLFVGAAAGGAYLWKRRRKPRRERGCLTT